MSSTDSLPKWIRDAIEKGYGEPITVSARDKAHKAIVDIADNIVKSGYTDRNEIWFMFLSALSTCKLDTAQIALYWRWAEEYLNESL